MQCGQYSRRQIFFLLSGQYCRFFLQSCVALVRKDVGLLFLSISQFCIFLDCFALQFGYDANIRLRGGLSLLRSKCFLYPDSDI